MKTAEAAVASGPRAIPGSVWALGIDPASGLPVRRSVLHRKDPEHKFNPTLVTADLDGEPVLLSQDGALYRLEKDDD